MDHLTFSQSGQDQFIQYVLNDKQYGTFLELGSNHPIEINNTFQLESVYDWLGVMVEMDSKYAPLYDQYRTSHYIIQDATNIDYNKYLQKWNFPNVIDYLQIDLEPTNYSTIKALQLLSQTVFPTYKFRVITFEHDVYIDSEATKYTQSESRKVFDSFGYVRVFENVKNNGNAYEDWYVHPECVDMNRVETLQKNVLLLMIWNIPLFKIIFKTFKQTKQIHESSI